MKKYVPIIIIFIVAVAVVLGFSFLGRSLPNQGAVLNASSFQDNFNRDSVLEEMPNILKSKSSAWWLSSGAYFITKNGIGSTNIGRLRAGSKWQVRYVNSTADSADGGYLPQNIFRLVSIVTQKSFEQQCYFRIVNYNKTQSKERNESNGIFFFNRYQDQDNVYYTGIRVDGAFVVKKKVGGEYFTMAYEKILTGVYNKDTNPNLLPMGMWFGLKSEVSDNPDGTVDIKLYFDENRSGNWKLVLEATDDGKNFGGAIIDSAGHGGIRTDFMDVEFSEYSIKQL